jgi:hypothetical protein
MTNRFTIATLKSQTTSGMGFGARLVDHVTGARYPLSRLISDGHGSYAPCGFDRMAQAQAAGRRKAAEILRRETLA